MAASSASENQLQVRALSERTVGEAAEVLLTFDGRVPRNLALRSLARRDLSGFDALDAEDRAPLDPSDAPEGSWRLGFVGPSRLVIRPEMGIEALGGRSVCAFVPSADFESRFWASNEAGQALDHAENRTLRDWIADEFDPLTLAVRVEAVRDAIAHIAPVVYYAGDTYYSNLLTPPTLVGKALLWKSERCALRQMMSSTDWDASQTRLFYCLSRLLESGGAYRLEELNSMQLTLENLRWVMADRDDRTEGSIASPVAPDRPANGTGTTLSYRHINGVTLNKARRQCVIDDSVTTAAVDRAVAAYATTALGGAGVSSPAQFSDAVARHVEHVPHEPDHHCLLPVERVLYDLCRIGNHLCRSDFAMTRGVRDIGDLREHASHGDWVAIAAPDIDAYYCCVVQADDVGADGLTPEQVAGIKWKIAARMQYNSWHFVPDVGASAGATINRDFYIAPRMPDLADWEDWNHAGHVEASVRFSIRVPIGVVVAGHEFPGLSDLRFMRQTGAPFDLDDLHTAIRLADYVAVVQQVLADAVEGRTIDAFTEAWYKVRG